MAEALQDLVLPDGDLLRWKDGAPGLALPTDALLRWAARRVGPLRAPRRGARGFASAGLAVLDTPDGRSAATLLAGPACPDELPAHGHADALAYEAVLDRVRVVASGGTADYAPGPERDRDRLPGAFAGVLVDGKAPADPYGAFRVGARGWVRDLRWGTTGDAAWACATSDGFARVGEPILHRRTLALLEGPLLVVMDEWTGSGEHEVDLRLPLRQSAEADFRGGSAAVVTCHAADLAFAPALSADGVRLDAERGAYAEGLGAVADREVVRGRARLAFPGRVVHAWTRDEPARRVTVTPCPPNELRIEVETAGRPRTCFVPQARRP
jgi:hypothetical protein